MVRRIAAVLAAAIMVLVGAVSPAAAAPVMISFWRAIDVDGSNLTLAVYDDGWTYSLDDDTSVCGGGLAKVYGPGVLDDAGNLLAADWTVSCASGPLVGPFQVKFSPFRRGTMIDSTGVVWFRFG